jgi:SAM-dependent methyltransferase
MKPEDIIPTYDRVGPSWAETRDCRLIEKRWLDRMLSIAPRHVGKWRVLDLGCGAGRPIASYLAERGAEVTGIDAAQAMIQLFQRAVPDARAYHLDMRGLALGETFDAILAWDSFFHLSPEDQRTMFGVFAAHAAPRAALMFTSGFESGTAIGDVEGERVYHASLDPAEYRQLLEAAGFEVVSFVPDDPDCTGHCVWLARSGDRNAGR